MKRYILTLLFFITIQCICAQVKYSTSWFGPNANPVPEFTDARIPQKTTISLMGDYYFGFGDETKNTYFKIEIPLLPERVSFNIWTSLFEHYKVSDLVSIQRDMPAGIINGKAMGDFYIQTRMRLLNEKKNVPSLILNSTLKTASGSNFAERRYFDTPGYYFDMEIGKSIYTKGKFINEIRAVGNLGFMCWETTNSVQNDAPMYGVKLLLGNNKWKLENTLSGYWGWMHSNRNYSSDYGDAPLVYASKFTIKRKSLNYFAQYQYGINDFPYHQMRVGVSFPVETLTPKYP